MALRKMWIFHCDTCGADDIGYMCDNKEHAKIMFKKLYIIENSGRCFCNEQCKREYKEG